MDKNEKLTIAICDDEKIMLKIIASSLKSSFEEIVKNVSIHAFVNVKGLDAFIKENKVDILFLDIIMPKADGVEYMKSLRESGNNIPVVFVTGSEERVWTTFCVQPFDFIRKNCFLSDLQRVVSRFCKEFKKQEKIERNDLIVSVKGEMHTIPIDSIKYIESQQRSQLIHYNDGREPLVINSQMRELEEQLEPYGFYRAHKGFIVNMRKIKMIFSKGITLDDGSTIPLNVHKVVEFKHIYLNYQQQLGNNVLLK